MSHAELPGQITLQRVLEIINNAPTEVHTGDIMDVIAYWPAERHDNDSYFEFEQTLCILLDYLTDHEMVHQRWTAREGTHYSKLDRPRGIIHKDGCSCTSVTTKIGCEVRYGR